MCEKVVIINDGRVVVEDLLANLTRDRSLEQVFIQSISAEAREAMAAEGGA